MSSDVIAAGNEIEVNRLRGEVARMRPIVEAAQAAGVATVLREGQRIMADILEQRERPGRAPLPGAITREDRVKTLAEVDRLLSAIEAAAKEAPHA